MTPTNRFLTSPALLTPLFAGLALFAIALATPACGDSGSGDGNNGGDCKAESLPCISSDECCTGLACTGGVCAPAANGGECTSNDDCEGEEVCNTLQGICVPPGGGVMGRTCSMTADCTQGQLCDFGLCKTSDFVACARDTDCTGADAICSGENALCVTNQCNTEENCAAGLECRDNKCLAPIQAECTEQTQDVDCRAGTFCHEGQCVQCVNDVDCGPGLTCAAGVCTSAGGCSNDADCAADGKVCNTRTMTCVFEAPPCADDSMCGPQQRCNTCASRCEAVVCMLDNFDRPNRNDSRATASPIANTVEEGLTLCNDNDEVDWYQVMGTAGQEMDVRVSEPTFNIDVYFDQDAMPLRSGTGRVPLNLPNNGTYYIKVASTCAYGAYSLVIRFQ